MPFTPFHFGPSSCIALPLQRYIDIPVFILANVIVDLEVLVVILFKLDYPLHGYFHTFLMGSLVEFVWGIIAYSGRKILKSLMELLHLTYSTKFKKIMFSAVLGVWIHVLLDAPLYSDIRPFYPFESNPLYGIVSSSIIHLICTLSFIPALIFYISGVVSFKRSESQQDLTF